MEYKTLLEHWGLVSIIPNFENEGIDDESFKLLDDSTIDQIFTKIGPKLIFKKKYRQFQIHQTAEFSSDIDDLTTDTASIVSSNTSTSDIVLEPDSELANILNTELGNFKFPLPPVPASAVPASAVTPSNTHELDLSFNCPKRMKKSSIFADNLENILEKSPDGKLVLMNRKKLNNDLRQKLSKIVISELLKSSGEKLNMTAEKFNAAADAIISLFPGEIKDTYFMPYSSPKTGLRRPARGKLWSRYVNVKAALRVANQNILDKSESRSEESVHAISEEIEREILFLRSATEPFPRVLTAWECTFNVRRQRYKDCGIEQVLDAFPCLKMSYGAELLESDFNQMFTDKIDVVYSEWPKISEAILKEVNERKIQPNFETDIDNSTRALLLLPYLFTPVTLKSNLKNKLNWRPTRCEIQESFIFRVKNLYDVAEIVDRRKAKLDNFNLPLQPFAVIVGETNDISFYIVFNENKYKCISSIRCLELLFKIFHALNLEYPSECKHIWHFIQDMVFLMPCTSKTSSTACAIADIRFHLN